MLASRASDIATEAMNTGHNCCEAVLMAANRIWNLGLSEDVMNAGLLFEEGMGSGCSCGALVGLVMVSGVLSRRYSHPLGEKLAPHLHEMFKGQFGSPCCRVICRNRPWLEKISKKGCKKLTGTTASLMVKVWEEVIRGGKQDLRNNTDT